MKKNLYVAIVTFCAFIFIQGCAAGPKPIPAAYFDKQHQISVQVSRIGDPSFRDSGQGGLIGLAVGLGRSSDMKEMFAGIKGDTVKELLRQEIEKKLEGAFAVEDDSKDLALEVQITQWGWFLPTTAFGIKTGSYQLEIIGQVSVNEITPEKKQIAGLSVYSQKPLGNEPTAELTQQALKQAIEDFAEKAKVTLLQEKKS
jgi:hypothetical protein